MEVGVWFEILIISIVYDSANTALTHLYSLYLMITCLLLFVIIQHTHHSRFIPEGVAGASLVFLEIPTFYQNCIAMRNKYSRRDK
jgi:hypothetical protein